MNQGPFFSSFFPIKFCYYLSSKEFPISCLLYICLMNQNREQEVKGEQEVKEVKEVLKLNLIYIYIYICYVIEGIIMIYKYCPISCTSCLLPWFFHIFKPDGNEYNNGINNGGWLHKINGC